MKRFETEGAAVHKLVCPRALLTACVLILAARIASSAPPSSAEHPVVSAVSPYIDAHTHFDERDPEGSVRAVIQAFQRENMVRAVLLILPDSVSPSGALHAAGILAVANKYPRRLAVLAGGETLNPMIQQSVRSGDAGAAIQSKFRKRAEELLHMGAAGFGEMAAEHFAGATPYQFAAPDHPLFLLLADIAAQHDVPIDLHMEAVPRAMPLPRDLKSPPNPPQLHENISAFERLLAHNPRAKIIWAHLGSDGTGYRTPDLCRRLLQKHSNLFMEIKLDPKAPGKNYLMAGEKIKPEWLKLFEDFPGRFIIGSDQHYPEPNGPQRWQEVVLLFNQLPANLRKSIGTENAAHIYDARISMGANH
ncbi:MAG TPA: amidohydrolase family protein [Bryobacteraceae bacterium]|nr:amidohydrolase family protein [Bryobacteraceae bacterium]